MQTGADNQRQVQQMLEFFLIFCELSGFWFLLELTAIVIYLIMLWSDKHDQLIIEFWTPNIN